MITISVISFALIVLGVVAVLSVPISVFVVHAARLREELTPRQAPELRVVPTGSHRASSTSHRAAGRSVHESQSFRLVEVDAQPRRRGRRFLPGTVTETGMLPVVSGPDGAA